jgi:RNA polymerase sigma factor (sigma-70 family)
VTALGLYLSDEGPRPGIAVEAAAVDVASDRFEDVYWPLYLRALRAAHRVLGDRDAAEDVAADALARTHLHWSRVRDLPYRDAWVLRVASNLALDAARRKAPALSAARSVAFEDRTVDRIALARAMRRLPRRQREAVALRYLAQLSHEEIASALGIGPPTVRTHVQRGLAALRATLQEEPS